MADKVQPHGGALRPGNPGNKGGGRPSNLFRQACRDALNDIEALDIVKKIAQKGSDNAKLGAIAWLTDYAYGKAPQKIEVEDVTDTQSTEEVVAALMALPMEIVEGLPEKYREGIKRLHRINKPIPDGKFEEE